MSNVTVAIDCMGGDHGPHVMVPAAVLALKQHAELSVILVGEQNRLLTELNRLKARPSSRLHIHHSSEVVTMSDKPSVALRSKRDSSMRVALELVRDGRADACVSAGNTGALMALSRFVIKMLPGVDRPAIISTLPTHSGGHSYMLDLGANVDCDAETLFQFAIMGSVLCSCIDGTSEPRVGLLNVGEEEIKGNDRVKRAAQLLDSSPAINYIGYVEGHDIFSDKADVIVTDGFTGNSVLKATEGLVRLLYDKLKATFTTGIYGRLVGLMVLPLLKRFQKRNNPDQFNGATLVGLRGIVVKSHGSANKQATVCAIREAIREVEQGVPQRIRHSLETLLANRSLQ